MKKIPVLFGLMVLLAAAGAHADQPRDLGDQRIQAIVEHDLVKHDIEGVNVSVKDAVVTLTGSVKSAWEKSKAVDTAMEVHDIEGVVDELTVRDAESDQALAKEVRSAIDRYVFYGVYDAVGATVSEGKVTLQGWVTWPYKASEIANHVSRVTGVKEVENKVQILPVSTFDDGLRVRLAVAIYRDLPALANRAHPPIHIVVNNGHVILAGAVRNKVEKMRSEHIARSMFGVFSVDDELRVG